MEELIPTLQEEGEERIDTLQESSIIAGVQSINGKAGDLDLKTINGQDILVAGNLDLATAEQLATKQDILTAGANIQIENNVISATDSKYTAGNGLALNGSEFSIDPDVVATKTDLSAKQDKLTQAQLTAVNSGIDSAKVTQIGTNQNDISTINGKIPNQASTTNQLADKAFVNSSVQTATANFRGSWADWDSVPEAASQYPADYTGSTTPTVNDYMVIQDASDYPYESLEGTWRFKYTGSWGNDGKEGWQPEYQVNETPMTAAQLAALNSGITDTLVAQISTNAGDIADLKTGKMDANTTFWGQTVQNGAVDGTLTITESGQTAAIETTGHNASDAAIRMGNSKNYVEAGLAGTTIASNNGNVEILAPSGTVNVNGRRITSLAMPSDSTDAASKRYVDNGLATKQDTLTAGAGITIAGATISVTDPAPSGFWTGAGTKISEGTDITIQNALATSPKNINLKGDIQQTTYTGKNLLDFTTATPATSQTTLTFVDNGFRVLTTATGYGARINISGLTASTTYTLSWEYTVETQCNPFIRVFKGTAQTAKYAEVNASTKHVTFTTDSEATALNIWFYNAVPGAGQVLWTDIQLEASASQTSYEPYVGGLPNPSPDYPEPISVVTGEQTIKVTGKNLFDIASLATTGITVSNGVATGTAGSFNSSFGMNTDGIMTPPSGQLSLSMTAYTDGNVSTQNTAGLLVRVEYSDGTNDSRTWNNSQLTPLEKTFTTASSKTVTKIALSYMNSGSNIWHISKFQIEFGNQATDYEPYKGQSYEVNLGKNLFTWNYSQFNNQGGTGSTYDYFQLPSDSDYTLTLIAKNAIGVQSPNKFIGFSSNGGSSSGTLWAWSASSTATIGQKFTVWNKASNVNRLYVSMYPNNETTFDWFVENFDIQLELGSTATSYAPYFTPIELCKIDTYQDYIYKSGDDWYVHKALGKVVLDGTESWQKYTIAAQNNASVFYIISISDFAIADNVPVCDYFKGLINIYGGASSANGTVAFNKSNSTPRLFFRYDALFGSSATAADFKTWLSTHNTTVYYALNTPTDELIVDADLVSDLDALLAAKLATGQNTINNSAISPNLPAIINVETFENNWNGLSEALLEA